MKKLKKISTFQLENSSLDLKLIKGGEEVDGRTKQKYVSKDSNGNQFDKCVDYDSTTTTPQ